MSMQVSQASQILISIIIPAYNSSGYLSTMLDSIYSQTYKNYEVIVAYDTKSTDDTLVILEKYQKMNNLIILSSMDESAGSARNRGLLHAKGDYVIFMDSDDLIVPTYLEDLLEVLVEYPDLDVVCGGRIDALETTVQMAYDKALLSKKDVSVYDSLTAIDMWIRGVDFPLTPWVYLVKKSYLDKNSIAFPNYSLGEDQVYVIQLLAHTDKVGINRKLGYVHILHPLSLSQSPKSYSEEWYAECCVQKDILQHLVSASYLQSARDFINQREVTAVHSFAKYDYSTFGVLLAENNINKLHAISNTSLINKMGCICFNHSKFAFYHILNSVLFRKRIRTSKYLDE